MTLSTSRPFLTIFLFKFASGVEGGIGISGAYQCSTDRGALLVTESNATIQEVTRADLSFPAYMKKHYHSWLKWARAHNHGVDANSIILVRGTVKVAGWAVFSYHSAMKKLSGEILFCAPKGLLRAGVTFLSHHYRDGRLLDRSGPDPPRLAGDQERDQCVFLRYWKVKFRARFLGLMLKAAASGDRLPDEDGGRGGPTVTTEDDEEDSSSESSHTVSNQLSASYSCNKH